MSLLYRKWYFSVFILNENILGHLAMSKHKNDVPYFLQNKHPHRGTLKIKPLSKLGHPAQKPLFSVLASKGWKNKPL